MRPTRHTARVQIVLDHPCGSHQIRIAGDRPGHPVDVRRLERRDVTKGVAVELPELDRMGAGDLERRRLRPAEMADPIAFHRTRGRGCPGRFLAHALAPHRRLARQAAGDPFGARSRPVRTDGLIPRSEGPAHVHATGDRACRPGSGRAAWTPSRRRVELRLGGRDPAAAMRGQVAGESRVGVVDLGHPPRRGPGGGRIVAGQVRMMGSCQPPPGGLDGGLIRSRLDTEDVVRIPFHHARQCTAAPGPTTLDSRPSLASPTDMGIVRRAGLIAAVAAAPLGLAYRFALAYRARAGYPRPKPPVLTPADLGLPYETTTVRSGDLVLPAWFLPARGGQPGPGVALVHGWESARDRTLPNAVFLNAAGYHCLTIDVRGHGANPPETLPISAGEFGLDALATFEALIARPEVTVGAIFGHSMGAIGAILAAAADARVAAVVATSAPADPLRLTRQTFRLARLPIPDPIAYPLAWLTTRVYLRPRGHRVPEISATKAIARYRGPILLAHGAEDAVVPSTHMTRLAGVARTARARGGSAAPVDSIVISGGQHSWLYEDPGYRAAVADFLATSLGGPLDPGEAGRVAAATASLRIPDGEVRFEAVAATPGGLRSLAQVAMPGATRIPVMGAGDGTTGVDGSAAAVEGSAGDTELAD